MVAFLRSGEIVARKGVLRVLRPASRAMYFAASSTMSASALCSRMLPILGFDDAIRDERVAASDFNLRFHLQAEFTLNLYLAGVDTGDLKIRYAALAERNSAAFNFYQALQQERAGV